MIRVTRVPAQGGLEDCKPSKKPPFLVMFAGKSSKHHQKKKVLERLDTLWVPAQRATA